MGCTTELKPRQQPYGYRRRSDHAIGQPRKCFRWRGFQLSARPGMFRVAKQQRNVPKPLKAQLIKDAGDKCANPGCSNWRVYLHHIKHWAVYKTHDGEHMISTDGKAYLVRPRTKSEITCTWNLRRKYVASLAACAFWQIVRMRWYSRSRTAIISAFGSRTAISFCRIALCEIVGLLPIESKVQSFPSFEFRQRRSRTQNW